MRNGRVAQHGWNICNTEAFIIQQVFGMFHPLCLIEIKNGGAE